MIQNMLFDQSRYPNSTIDLYRFFDHNETIDQHASIDILMQNVTLEPNRSSTKSIDLLISESIIFSLIFMIISAAGVIGNILVIIAIGGDSKMRKSTMNALLLNLAVADLLNVMACVPEFTLLLINRGWLLYEWLCPLLRLLERVFLYTSLLTQLAVGIERFYAIAYPMKVHLFCSLRKVTWWTVFIWFIAIISSLPYGWHKIKTGSSGDPQCIWILANKTKLSFRSAECLLFYFLPLLLILILYSFISARLWSRNHQLHEGRNDNVALETLKTRQNVVKMLIVCVCVYFICYSPIQAIFISTVLFGKQVRFGMSAVLTMNTLVVVCSTANPIVYTFYSHKFRRKFAQLLCCKRYDRKSAPVHSTQHSLLVHNNNNPKKESEIIQTDETPLINYENSSKIITYTPDIIEKKSIDGKEKGSSIDKKIVRRPHSYPNFHSTINTRRRTVL